MTSLSGIGSLANALNIARSGYSPQGLQNMAVPQEPKRAHEVPLLLEALGKSLEVLRNEIGTLEGELGMALLPDSPKGQGQDRNEPPVRSQIADRLSANLEQVEMVMVAVRRLRERLDV